MLFPSGAKYWTFGGPDLPAACTTRVDTTSLNFSEFNKFGEFLKDFQINYLYFDPGNEEIYYVSPDSALMIKLKFGI